MKSTYSRQTGSHRLIGGGAFTFDTSDKGLCCATDLSENPFNVLRFHDKTLYILVIDLVKRGAASKMGKLKQIVMEREDFVIDLNEAEQQVPQTSG